MFQVPYDFVSYQANIMTKGVTILNLYSLKYVTVPAHPKHFLYPLRSVCLNTFCQH